MSTADWVLVEIDQDTSAGEADNSSAVLADVLVQRWADRQPTAVTWLNHHTAGVFLHDIGGLATFDLVGIDGFLLRNVLGRPMPRTSADLVLPLVLPRLHGARVVLLGGPPETLPERSAHVHRLIAGDAVLVANVDGYASLPSLPDLPGFLAAHAADVVLLGLGAGLQEEYGAAIARAGLGVLVLTCGGFLDQVSDGKYYPAWAYPLRLNWAVRLARDPKRLWRRYTVEAVGTLLRAHRLRRMTRRVPGIAAMAELLR